MPNNSTPNGTCMVFTSAMPSKIRASVSPKIPTAYRTDPGEPPPCRHQRGSGARDCRRMLAVPSAMIVGNPAAHPCPSCG